MNFPVLLSLFSARSSVPPASRRYILQQIDLVIRTKGKISYKELMEIALYNRDQGFYTRHLKIGLGPENHFCTRSVQFSPDYGEALAHKFLDYIREYGNPAENLDLVALGDGTGVLLRDIINTLHKSNLNLRKISIDLVERFTSEQKRRLEGMDVNVLTGSALTLPLRPNSIRGIVYANELLDQLPATLAVNLGGKICEKYIVYRGGRFHEHPFPASDPEINNYFRLTGNELRPGESCAVSPGSVRLLHNLFSIMKEGLIFFIDYNIQNNQLFGVKYLRYGEERPLFPKSIPKAIGMDITVDVDFEALKLIAAKIGFKVISENSEFDFLKAHYPSRFRSDLIQKMRVLVLQK